MELGDYAARKKKKPQQNLSPLRKLSLPGGLISLLSKIRSIYYTQVYNASKNCLYSNSNRSSVKPIYI